MFEAAKAVGDEPRDAAVRSMNFFSSAVRVRCANLQFLPRVHLPLALSKHPGRVSASRWPAGAASVEAGEAFLLRPPFRLRLGSFEFLRDFLGVRSFDFCREEDPRLSSLRRPLGGRSREE